MKKIAMITGASGGIGQIFVRELAKETLDEIWVIGRNDRVFYFGNQPDD